MAHLPKKNFRLKYSDVKITGKYLYYSKKRKWCPSNIYNLKNYLNKNLRSRAFQNINYKTIRLSFYLVKYLVKD